MHFYHIKKYLKVSLKQLKQELRAITAETASGTLVEVRRYNKPFLHLLSIRQHGTFVGENVGKFSLKPLSGAKLSRSKRSIVDELLKDRE